MSSPDSPVIAWHFKFNNGVTCTIFNEAEAQTIAANLEANESVQELVDRNALEAVQSVPEHIRSIKIPTDTMEQEFQTHYRRGFEAGKKSAQSVPVVGDVVAWKADNGHWAATEKDAIEYTRRMHKVMHPLVIKPTTSITAAEPALCAS